MIYSPRPDRPFCALIRVRLAPEPGSGAGLCDESDPGRAGRACGERGERKTGPACSAFPVSPGLTPMASPCRFLPFRPESTAFSRRDHYRLRSGSSVWLPGRLWPSSRYGSLSEADASSESLLRRLSRDPAEPRLADPPASLPSLCSGNEGNRKAGRADVGLPGVSPGWTPVSLRSDSPATLTRPGGIVGRSQPYYL